MTPNALKWLQMSLYMSKSTEVIRIHLKSFGVIKSWGDKIYYTINMQRSLSFFVGSQTQMNENGNVPSETVSTHCDSSTYLLSVLYYALLLFSRRRWCKATDLSLSSISRSFVSIDIARLRHQTSGVGDGWVGRAITYPGFGRTLYQPEGADCAPTLALPALVASYAPADDNYNRDPQKCHIWLQGFRLNYTSLDYPEINLKVKIYFVW